MSTGKGITSTDDRPTSRGKLNLRRRQLLTTLKAPPMYLWLFIVAALYITGSIMRILRAS